MILSEINNFKVEFNDIKYIIKFDENNDKIYITQYNGYKTFLLENKKYNIRIYNNINCINKLRNGLIRKYQVHNLFEIEVLSQYLTNKNILYRIIEKNMSFTRKYVSEHLLGKIYDKSYKYCFNINYPPYDKIIKPNKLYIEVYKGFINLTDIKYRYSKSIDYKYGIYL